MPGVALGAGKGVNVLVAVGAVLARLVFEILGDRFEIAPVGDDRFVFHLLLFGLFFHWRLLPKHKINSYTVYRTVAACATG